MECCLARRVKLQIGLMLLTVKIVDVLLKYDHIYKSLKQLCFQAKKATNRRTNTQVVFYKLIEYRGSMLANLYRSSINYK